MSRRPSRRPSDGRGPKVFALGIAVGLAACAAPDEVATESAEIVAAPAVPVQPFAELGGPFRVGVRDLYLVDEERPEPFTSDPEDGRRLLVRVWYPATIDEGDQPASYVPAPEEFDGSAAFAGVLHVLTRGYADADPDPSAAPYPVLLFHPGGGWTRLSDTFWTEQLASHGYVVFAVDHPGFNQSVVFPDGFRFSPDRLSFPEETGDLGEDARAAWRHLDEHHFPLWLEDSVSLLDHVEELAEGQGPFAGLLDLERVGAFGWSFGGALSVQLTRYDPRVQAAVNGDGQLFGDVAETGTDRPVLLLHGDPALLEAEATAQAAAGTDQEAEERARVLRELMAEVEARNRSLAERSPEVWRVTIRGASHGHFSDLVLAAPAEPEALAPERGHEVIVALSLAFFQHALKGEPGALLDEIESRFPEAIEVHRPAPKKW